MQIPEYIRATSMVFCIIIMCLGVIGNIMVPIVILKTKDMRNSTNIFLTNLSIADLLVLLICTPTVLVEVNSPPEVWVLGEEMCKAVPFVELTVAHASVLTILAISFERYYAICEPLKAGYVCTKTRALMICLAAWTVAAILTSPILTMTSYEYGEYFNRSVAAFCTTPVETTWQLTFYLSSIVVFFFFPLFILVVLYSVIAKNLMDNPSIIMSNASGNRNHVVKYRKQVIFMLGAVVASFFFCLLPFRALTLWILIVPTEKVASLGLERFYILLYFCRIMLYMNSAINPILYNLMSSKFRNGFLQLLGCGKMIRSDSMSSGVRKGTFHTTSTNLSSSHNSSIQRRLTREESVSGSIRAVTDYGGRKRLLYQRHNSTVSIKSYHDEAEECRPSQMISNGGPLENSSLKARRITELESESGKLPTGYGFHRYKHPTSSHNFRCNINSGNDNASQRLNGSFSVDPRIAHQMDNKYVLVRTAVVVVREVEEQSEQGMDQTSPTAGSETESSPVPNTHESEQIVSIITANKQENDNGVNQDQNVVTDRETMNCGTGDTAGRMMAHGEKDLNQNRCDDEVDFDEITKIRQFYGSMECDI
ncbi:pyrokinin-1 receptor isoform X2 [Toxorhynchites rutilus septentrionalis]|uniref:pyrokinin-1 receptor isoform X2 n=1 Tax=Toxorhynchites rutilus septentrionalis TaxID=329112 RepID=UPI002479238E|nr:pyrokinin-1 receptor isoform X2 [Toxorhynchites rutilus septentrionalis]